MGWPGHRAGLGRKGSHLLVLPTPRAATFLGGWTGSLNSEDHGAALMTWSRVPRLTPFPMRLCGLQAHVRSLPARPLSVLSRLRNSVERGWRLLLGSEAGCPAAGRTLRLPGRLSGLPQASARLARTP